MADGRIAPPPDVCPRVSVIIPVLDDAVRLATCLGALEQQSFAHGFEVLVVDNGSSDDPVAAVAKSTRARLLREPRRSSYAARNLGASMARGDILAFTDSDCVPAREWLARGVGHVEEASGPVFVGGPVDVFVRDPDRPTAAELYEAIHAFPQRRYVETLFFSVTANLLVPRHVFTGLGGFNGCLESGGDWEWGQRARQAGVRPVYADDVRVAHPSRRTIAEMNRKNRRRFEGDARLRALGGAPPRRFVLRRIVQPPVRSTVRNLRSLEPPTARSMALYAAARMAVHYTSAYHEARTLLRQYPSR